MLYFTTLFDSSYLSRGLILHESLLKYCPDFHLYIFAFDNAAFEILEALHPEKTTIISLPEFETQELLDVKKSRSIAEYCWTCTPSTIYYVIEKFKVPHCTYLDADLQFFSNPSVLVNEMISNNKSVLITEHRFSLLPKLYEEKRGGRFCVQFVTFKNEADSLNVLNKWKNQCIEWCYSRYEDGKFGDQKYLEEWPSIYQNIHILQHPGGGLAPWNVQQYRFEMKGDDTTGFMRKNKLQFLPVFYHFQYVKQVDNGKYDIGWYLIPGNVKKMFYFPYLKRLTLIEDRLLRDNSGYRPVFARIKANSPKSFLKVCLKRLIKYNIIKIN